jgi:hypothetical protein
VGAELVEVLEVVVLAIISVLVVVAACVVDTWERLELPVSSLVWDEVSVELGMSMDRVRDWLAVSLACVDSRVDVAAFVDSVVSQLEVEGTTSVVVIESEFQIEGVVVNEEPGTVLSQLVEETSVCAVPVEIVESQVVEIGCEVLQELLSPSQLLGSCVLSVSLAVLLLLGRATVEVKKLSEVRCSAEDDRLVTLSQEDVLEKIKVPVVCSEAVGKTKVVTVESVWIDEVESYPCPVVVEADDSLLVLSKSVGGIADGVEESSDCVVWMLEQSGQLIEEIGAIGEDAKLGVFGNSMIEVTPLVSAEVKDKIPVVVVQCKTGIVDVVMVVTTEVMRRVFATTERHASAAAKGRPIAMKIRDRIL